MVMCPECDSEIDIEEEDMDEGDVLSCDECGASLTVLGKNPLELEAADDYEETADEDEDEDEDDELIEEEVEKEESEDEWH
jgi:alpha-aminoadipate/glutamate carrier protein LysW